MSRAGLRATPLDNDDKSAELYSATYVLIRGSPPAAQAATCRWFWTKPKRCEAADLDITFVITRLKKGGMRLDADPREECKWEEWRDEEERVCV